MIRSLAVVLTLTVGATGTVQAAGWSLTDLNLDRLRWNERERTATGIDALEGGEAQRAIGALETAVRLDPNDPLLRFNAGSAHLATGSEGAMEHLEAAAETAPEALQSAANYNLGNARLAAEDPAGAIEAYENALRSDPANENAKFNLELALQQQQEEQQQQDAQDGNEESDQQDQQDQQQQSGDEQQQQPEQNQQPEQQEGEGEQDQQLPQFEDQPDMTAEQAAAILEAVENLEREQRRKAAEEEMKKRPRNGKDW